MEEAVDDRRDREIVKIVIVVKVTTTLTVTNDHKVTEAKTQIGKVAAPGMDKETGTVKICGAREIGTKVIGVARLRNGKAITAKEAIIQPVMEIIQVGIIMANILRIGIRR